MAGPDLTGSDFYLTVTPAGWWVTASNLSATKLSRAVVAHAAEFSKTVRLPRAGPPPENRPALAVSGSLRGTGENSASEGCLSTTGRLETAGRGLVAGHRGFGGPGARLPRGSKPLEPAPSELEDRSVEAGSR